ncbi:hypothetical protein NL676_008725 [Syzygium grande]|nr:hypothetical protein NL676_008725 [Syzygium grande]
MIHTYSQIAEFSIPLTGRIYPVQLPGSHDQTLSTPGWILVSKGGREYQIFNPLSGISIELPTLEKLHHQLHLFDMMALSSSPSLSRSYTVVISYGISPGFAILRSGEDAWTGTEEEVKSLGDVSLFLNGNSSFTVDFNAKSCLPGIKPNRVYYSDYKDDQMKSYRMEDGKFETYLDATSSCLFDATCNCHFDATRHQIFEAEWFQPDFGT